MILSVALFYQDFCFCCASKSGKSFFYLSFFFPGDSSLFLLCLAAATASVVGQCPTGCKEYAESKWEGKWGRVKKGEQKRKRGVEGGGGGIVIGCATMSFHFFFE